MHTNNALRVLDLLQQFITEFAQQPIRFFTSQSEGELFKALVTNTHDALVATISNRADFPEANRVRLRLKANFISEAIDYHLGTGTIAQAIPPLNPAPLSNSPESAPTVTYLQDAETQTDLCHTRDSQTQTPQRVTQEAQAHTPGWHTQPPFTLQRTVEQRQTQAPRWTHTSSPPRRFSLL